MLLDTLLSQMPTTVHNLHFPVYGLIEHPLDLSVCSYGEGNSSAQHKLYSITFTFTSPRYVDERENVEIVSANAAIERQEKGHVVFDLTDAQRTYLFRRYHLTDEEQAQAGTPTNWEGTLTIDGHDFSARIQHWSQPRQLALFLLKSKESVISGMSCGPSYQEVIELLQSLQAINTRNDVLEEYQNELYQELRKLLDQWNQ